MIDILERQKLYGLAVLTLDFYINLNKIELNESNCLLVVKKAYWFLKLNKFNEALALIDKYDKILPKLPEMFALKGMIVSRLPGDNPSTIKTAIQNLENAISLNPKLRMTNYELALLHYRSNQNQMAEVKISFFFSFGILLERFIVRNGKQFEMFGCLLSIEFVDRR